MRRWGGAPLRMKIIEELSCGFSEYTVVGKPQLRNGKITFVVPANGAVLLKFAPA
jgi:hypothetical protein